MDLSIPPEEPGEVTLAEAEVRLAEGEAHPVEEALEAEEAPAITEVLEGALEFHPGAEVQEEAGVEAHQEAPSESESEPETGSEIGHAPGHSQKEADLVSVHFHLNLSKRTQSLNCAQAEADPGSKVFFQLGVEVVLLLVEEISVAEADWLPEILSQLDQNHQRARNLLMKNPSS